MKKLCLLALTLMLAFSAMAETEWKRDPAQVGSDITIYTTLDDARNGTNLCYQENDDPDFDYYGNP